MLTPSLLMLFSPDYRSYCGHLSTTDINDRDRTSQKGANVNDFAVLLQGKRLDFTEFLDRVEGGITPAMPWRTTK
ncbi:MAG TPA: hypothetical protein ENH48_09585 [Halieaceae bacterium]|nr:hypothetical protein [Halieaceae bacterium]